MITEIYSDVKHLKKIVDGNGKPGLTGDVKDNTSRLDKMAGRDTFIKFAIGGGWVVSMIMYYIK